MKIFPAFDNYTVNFKSIFFTIRVNLVNKESVKSLAQAMSPDGIVPSRLVSISLELILFTHYLKNIMIMLLKSLGQYKSKLKTSSWIGAVKQSEIQYSPYNTFLGNEDDFALKMMWHLLYLIPIEISMHLI